jgi:drug/metabolite transporter (DMT)-like permease
MTYFLLFLSTIVTSTKALVFKGTSTKASSMTNVFLSNALTFLVALVVALFMAGERLAELFTVSNETIILAAIFSLVTLFTQVTQILAMMLGTASSTSLIYSCGFLVPTFAGVIFWQEKVSTGRIIGVALIVLAVYLIVDTSKDKRKKSLKWLAAAVSAMLLAGACGVVQKIQAGGASAGELPLFLIFTFFFSSSVSFVIFIIKSRRAGKNYIPPSSARSFCVLAVISGCCLGFANLINFTIAGKLPATVQFPVYNIGNMVLTGVLSAIIFKERPGKRQIAGYVIGCAAMAIIGLL